MVQIYDETLVMIDFDIEGENNELIPIDITNTKQIANLNTRYFEELISFEKAKNKVFSTINLQYNIFSSY